MTYINHFEVDCIMQQQNHPYSMVHLSIFSIQFPLTLWYILDINGQLHSKVASHFSYAPTLVNWPEVQIVQDRPLKL